MLEDHLAPDDGDRRGRDRPVLLSLRSARRVLGRAGHRSRGCDRVAPAGAADLRRAPARPAAGRTRPDDRLDRAADHRRRARRARPSVLGRHGVPADRDGFRAALRQARRSLRAQDRPPGRDRDLPRRLGTLRPLAEHGPADRLSRRAGARRRRADRGHAGRRRRHHPAARARQVPGLLRRGVRAGDDHRPAARRLLRRQPELALDLLRQPAGGDRRAERDRGHVPRAGGDAAPRDGLRGRRAACGRL